VILLAALEFGLVADMVTSHTGPARLDAGAADWGARDATPTSTTVMVALTRLGSTTVVAEAILMGLLDWLRRHRWTTLAFMMVVV